VQTSEANTTPGGMTAGRFPLRRLRVAATNPQGPGRQTASVSRKAFPRTPNRTKLPDRHDVPPQGTRSRGKRVVSRHSEFQYRTLTGDTRCHTLIGDIWLMRRIRRPRRSRWTIQEEPISRAGRIQGPFVRGFSPAYVQGSGRLSKPGNKGCSGKRWSLMMLTDLSLGGLKAGGGPPRRDERLAAVSPRRPLERRSVELMQS
jgi:hypothetical protein